MSTADSSAAHAASVSACEPVDQFWHVLRHGPALAWRRVVAHCAKRAPGVRFPDFEVALIESRHKKVVAERRPSQHPRAYRTGAQARAAARIVARECVARASTHAPLKMRTTRV